MLEHSKGVLGLWNTFSWLGSIRIPLMKQLRSIGNVRSLIAPVAIIQAAGGNSSKYDHDENVHLSRTQQWLVDVVCVFLFEWKDINEGLNHTGLI